MSFFFLLPNILLSGFMFPWEAMPRAAQFLSQALPLTHFLRIVRGITLKGSGLRTSPASSSGWQASWRRWWCWRPRGSARSWRDGPCRAGRAHFG